VIFIGMGGTVLSMTQGEEPEGLPDSGYRDSALMIGPPLFLLLLVLVLGLALPEPFRVFLEDAAALLEVI
jgi:hydrogenase-4 component F